MICILTSSDNKKFEVDEKILKLSETLSLALSFCGGTEPFPLSNIDGTTLAHVIEIFKMWVDDVKEYEKPAHGGQSMMPEKNCPEFVYMRKLTHRELYPLCRAGGYLGCQRLTDITCFFVHDLVKRMTRREKCLFFGEEYDDKYVPPMMGAWDGSAQ